VLQRTGSCNSPRGRLLRVVLLATALAACTAAAAAVRTDGPPLPALAGGPAGSAGAPAAGERSPQPAPSVAPDRDGASARSPAERARVPSARTVRGALRRAHAVGAIDRSTYRVRGRTLRRARAVAGRLTGRARIAMVGALATVGDLAARRLLSADRMRVAFLALRRNAQLLARGTVPAPGERFTFGGDPAVFQYFPGHGLVFHPLGSFGRVNARARICVEQRVQAERGGERCRARAVRRALDRLSGLAVRRGGFTAWEYLVPYGGGRAPWISAMAQAVAIQALARGAKALGVRRWRSIAEDALGAFERATPTGVRVAVPTGTDYALYSFAPSLRILNGSLQALLGLYDQASLSGSRRARRLFRDAEPTVRDAVAAHDTGSWSLYARGGSESPLNYHNLVVGQLAGLCQRLRTAAYCDARRRFAAYGGPPRVWLAWRGRTRVGRPTPIAFTVSQSASIRVMVRRGGRTLLAREIPVAAGRHVMAWTPSRPGRHRLTLRATGRMGTAVRHATLTVLHRPRVRERAGRSHDRDGVRRRRRRDEHSGARRRRPQAPSPTATPTPDATPSPQPVPSVTAAPSPGATASPTPTPSPRAASSPEPRPSPEPSRPPDPELSPEPADTPAPTAQPRAAPTPTPAATPEPDRTLAQGTP
jgi:D-glucuronyl C5-epimerase C-terminus